MNTIKEKVSTIEIIKKSKFLTFLHPIHDINEAKELIEYYNKQYSDATHVCYAYILDENTYKYYDDGEPSSSAGAPMYQVLKNNKLIYTFAVVIRYFGGVKLGVGGLTHAYSSGIINLLTQDLIIEYKKYDEYLIELPYSLFDSFSYYLNKKGIAINDKQFLDNIFLSIYLDESTILELKDLFPNISFTLSK